MKVKEILDVITDNKMYAELIEEESGASFGILNAEEYKRLTKCEKTLYEKFGEKEVDSINAQYINGKRLLVIKFKGE